MDPQTTILLCDDSRAMRMMTAALLAENGFNVVSEADNGVDAVEKYKSVRPGVVLLDLVMPQKDGKQALQEILAFDANAKVVVLSSLGAKSDIEECLRMGAKSYLQKPIDPEALVRVLGEVAG